MDNLDFKFVPATKMLTYHRQLGLHVLQVQLKI